MLRSFSASEAPSDATSSKPPTLNATRAGRRRALSNARSGAIVQSEVSGFPHRYHGANLIQQTWRVSLLGPKRPGSAARYPLRYVTAHSRSLVPSRQDRQPRGFQLKPHAEQSTQNSCHRHCALAAQPYERSSIVVHKLAPAAQRGAETPLPD